MHVVPNVLFGIQMRFLRQVPHCESSRQSSLAIELLIDAGHDFQQCTFTSTVAAEHANFSARVKRQPNVLKNRFLAMLLGHGLHLINVLLRHIGYLLLLKTS